MLVPVESVKRNFSFTDLKLNLLKPIYKSSNLHETTGEHIIREREREREVAVHNLLFVEQSFGAEVFAGLCWSAPFYSGMANQSHG